jgi:hypothetical protein
MIEFVRLTRFMNRNFSWRPTPAWAALAAIAVIGCSGEKKGDPNGKPVSGKVTYNGGPVEGASVTFSSPTASAFGITDAEGKYRLTTAGGDKVSLGQYRVSIVKKEAPAPSDAAPDSANYVPPDPNAAPAAPPKDLLPAKYADAATSELTASVTADGKNEFDFPLTD